MLTHIMHLLPFLHHSPPFNAAARARANMGPEWYEPLITPPEPSAKGGKGGGGVEGSNSQNAKVRGRDKALPVK